MTPYRQALLAPGKFPEEQLTKCRKDIDLQQVEDKYWTRKEEQEDLLMEGTGMYERKYYTWEKI